MASGSRSLVDVPGCCRLRAHRGPFSVGALDEFRIAPIKTTISLHRRLMAERQFVDADYDIHYLERLLRAEGTAAGESVRNPG